MKAVFNILLLLLLAGLYACNPSSATLDEAYFFDLKGYFDNQLSELKKVEQLQKSTVFNGQKEEKILDSIDFSRELIVFIESDINRSAWLDKYRVDSILNASGQLIQIVYTAQDPSLKTQKMTINFAESEVERIEILNVTGSILSDSRQDLVFIPQRGYSISSRQQLIFFTDRSLSVEVNFLN